MRGHNIIQYNCGNANGKSARPFLDSLEAEEYPIIAIQEPMITTRTGTRTYCPRNYRLSRPAEEGMRVVFFIHELIPLTDWEVVSASTHCEHIRIRTQGEEINMINAYNPPGLAGQHQIEVLPQLAQILRQTTQEDPPSWRS